MSAMYVQPIIPLAPGTTTTPPSNQINYNANLFSKPERDSFCSCHVSDKVNVLIQPVFSQAHAITASHLEAKPDSYKPSRSADTIASVPLSTSQYADRFKCCCRKRPDGRPSSSRAAARRLIAAAVRAFQPASVATVRCATGRSATAESTRLFGVHSG